MSHPHSIEQLLGLAALAGAVLSAAILLWYLLSRPPLNRAAKFWLLLGLGALPIAVALSGNVAGFEHTKQRAFCGACHVMGAYVRDAADPKSQSLAAIHGRNPQFGDESCYVCHADYSLFGAVVTKVSGLKHLWYYATVYARTGPDGEGGPPIKLYRPFEANTCRRCHTTFAPKFVETHGDALEAIRGGDASCLDCHTEVHPTALAHRTAPAQEKKP